MCIRDSYYCGRRLGTDAIPGSDGRCGIHNGPQCASCKHFQSSVGGELFNDDGVSVKLGGHWGSGFDGSHLYFCGRNLGRDAIPDSDGQCGPTAGPQCASCKRFQARSKSPAAWYSEGEARRKEEKWLEAIAAFQNCVALDANDSEAWYELGCAYFGQNGDWCEDMIEPCLLYTSPSPRDATLSRMPSSA